MALFHSSIFTIFFLSLTVSTTKDPFGDQPRLSVENGHLTVRGAKNRNLTLLSSGDGSVWVNEVDFSTMFHQIVRSYLSGSLMHNFNIEQISRHVQDLQNQWAAVENMDVQIDQLENNITTISRKLDRFIGGGSQRISSFRRFIRKLNNLENRFLELTQSLSTNECANNPCRNGGSCIDSFNAFICQCPDNWEGPTCDIDVNECSRYYGTSMGCQNGATCYNSPGSYRCECQPNWYGIHCTENHDDCSSASHQELCGHGTCINENRVVPGQPKYRCICEEGWTRGINSPACDIDVDECSGSNVACSKNPPVSCINLPGTFHCGPCPNGYTGNGQVCIDINECVTNNGGCSRNPYVTCLNTVGSRQCGSCPNGYIGDGVQCMFMGGCSINRGGCHPLATCVDNSAVVGSQPTCVCPPGYVGNGEGPTGCVQSQGLTCSNNPCVHGVCQANGQSIQCTCYPGYTGTLCDQTVNACYSQPCLNGGTCTSQGTGYTCTCTDEFEGSTCADTKHVCGGIFNGNNGTIIYPINPEQPYRNLENCGWVIVVEEGMVVNITIERLHLEPSANCDYDFLQIHDGYSMTSPILGRYCGIHNNFNMNILSNHHNVYVWFHSDHSVAGLGFNFFWNATMPVCGGELNVTEYGAINSPGYPGRYPGLSDCYWLVRVPTGRRIRFQFATLQLEQHENCSFDFLKLIDGANENDPTLVTYCTTVTPPPVTSSSSTVLAHFHSDRYVEDTGFHITYAAVPGVHGCGGLLTNPTGTFTSPNYPDTYDSHLVCEWLIRIHPGDRILLTFTDFELEVHRDCRFDYVEIYDGSTDADRLLRRYCGSDIPPAVTSVSHQLFIKFQTDSSVQRNGFKAQYKTICGGFFSQLQGSFHSPFFPDFYPNHVICKYHIILPPGNIIQLQFPVLALEQNAGCTFDHVEINDGGLEENPVIGRFCDQSSDIQLTSSFNEMLVTFRSDGSVQNRGFYANYTNVDVGCGGVMATNNGYIHTPMHPQYYPPSIRCSWMIHAPPGFIIQLTFQTFVMENHEHCNYDYVAVNDSTGSSMGKYCGTAMPPILTSTDNVMMVTFVSDYSNNLEGFNATYTFFDASQVCGGDLYVEEGRIISPGYPQSYPHDKTCVWLLHAANGHQLSLTFQAFALETHADCKFDYLEIRNGGYSTSPVEGKYCGTIIPQPIISHSNILRLEFDSDGSQTGPGFEILYNTALTGCGGTLSSPRGTIISPNYPDAYGHNSECTWIIHVSEGSIASITIVIIDIERHMSCQFDYLEIFDGITENSPSLGRFCNDRHIPPVISSTGNKAMIKFRTDSSGSGRGFHLIYQTSCNTELKGRKGIIESPNFHFMYPHNYNCTWKINAPAGSNISLAFSHLFLENTMSCEADYVEFREFYDEGQEKSLAKYCGTPFPLPPATVTAWNIALVRFVTDSSVSHDGFRLEWRVIGCGGDLTKPMGRITSPNYPNAYPHHTDCYWYIKYPEDKRISLTIMDLDLEYANSCPYDFLRVYAGDDESAPRILNSCKKITEPQVLRSHGNQMVIHFHSDLSVPARGFRAMYSQLSSGCGGIYTVSESMIMSPSYPGLYNANDECDWLIQMDPVHLIVLEFYDFSLPTSANCTNGYVAIYDGANSSMPLLRKLCGGMPEDSIISSTGNEMLVRLKADGNNVGNGFKAHYKPGCGRRIIADRGGEITSPGYPLFSEDFYNCSWIIAASDPGEKVVFLITRLHVLYRGDCDMNNVFIEVRDGDQQESPLIGKYCGTEAPPTITSRGNTLHIYLQMHGLFRATYGIISTHCGGTLLSDSGTFTSPNYPDNYPMRTECVWVVQASAGNLVQVMFQTFNIGSSDYCNMDYVEIHENDAGGPLIGRYCGNQLPPSVSAVNKMWIKFQSDEFGTSPGFTAQYNLVHGMQLNASQGFIESPGYPHTIYYSNTEGYQWQIVVPEGNSITVQFLDMEIRPHGLDNSLCYSSVQLFDGPDDTAPLLGEYCGYTTPTPIISFGSQIFIKFTNAERGGPVSGKWRLTWFTVDQRSVVVSESPLSESSCFHVVELNTSQSLEIQSEGYPLGYGPYLNCTWVIRAQPMQHIRLRIIDLHLEGYDNSCLYDKLEVYIAPHAFSALWALNTTFCGRIENTVLEAPNNILKMVFTTDGSTFLTGFKVGVEGACGGEIHGQNGVLKSSDLFQNMPSAFQSVRSQLICDWVIRVGTRRTMRIYFERFNMPSDEVCSSLYSSILILNGGRQSSPMLGRGKYCGVVIPSVPDTLSDTAFVRLYIPGHTTSYPEFELHFTEISLSCGGHLYIDQTTPFVEIQSPNYPSPPPHPIDCNWIIMSPSGTRMRIDLENELHLTGDCWQQDNQEFLEFSDGGTEAADPIRRYCSHDRPYSIWTTGNSLYTTYLTQVEHPGSGFKAKIQTAICGGKYFAWSGMIRSPDYPLNYSSGLDCHYTIEVRYGYSAVIVIHKLDTPPADDCRHTDYIEVREEDEYGELVGLYCGNVTRQIINLGGRKAYVIFRSDSSRTGTGFELMYRGREGESCGPSPEIIAESGILTSPGFPLALPNRKECFWFIRAPEGRSVSLTFTHFNLPGNLFQGDCASSLTVSNISLSYMRHSGQQLCGIQLPETIQSSTNQMYLKFRTHGLLAGEGFSLSYNTYKESACGALLPAPSGLIISPNFTFSNHSFINCLWKIDSEGDNRTTSVQFDMLDISGDLATYCRSSRLNLFSLGSVPRGQSFCGNLTVKRPIFTNPFRETGINFAANMSVPFSGFRATYNISDCGGIVESADAFITSPGYPNNYSANLYCNWLIKSPSGDRVKLTFLDFRLEDDCKNDYVLVSNSRRSYYPVLGKFCGTRLPQAIESDTSEITLLFHSNEYGSAPGFKVTLADVEQGCGGVTHLKRGVISSPNYPNKYVNNVECVWDIEATPGHVINVTFVERFDIEQEANCNNDYILIEDFDGRSWVEMPKICGSQKPTDFISQSTKLRLTFHSNGLIQGDGFKLEHHAACGGYYSNKAGVIYSPDHPLQYGNKLHCQYFIGQPGHYLDLAFDPNEFSIEESQGNCPYDYVTIYSGNTTSSDVYGTYCGIVAPALPTVYGQILITFTTDASVSGNGFILHYEVSECGGIRTEDFGVIKSPGYPKEYMNNMYCTWEIHTPENTAISLKFGGFELEAVYGCIFDYVDIFDGNETSGRHIGKICGNKIPPIVQSTLNHMMIRFVTDSSYVMKGFTASFRKTYGVLQGCGGVMIAASGEFSSLDIDNDGNYESNLDCSWKLVGTADQAIKITFSQFDVELENRSCSYDYVEIRDGLDMQAPTIGRYCGSSIPSSVKASSNKVVVIFHSDGITNKRGFRASFTSVPTLCGSSSLTVSETTQTLTSPNYPDTYPPNLFCRWNFFTNSSYNYLILLSFARIDVPCTREFLQIHENKRVDSRTYRLCGDKYPDQVLVSNGAWISLHTDQSGEGHGFSLTYKFSGCDRNYTRPNGVISFNSDSYGFNAHAACIMQVQAPPGKTISLYFGPKIVFYPENQCDHFYLKVYDGTSTSSSVLSTICVSTSPSPVFSTGNILTLELTTQYAYFYISYTTTSEGRGCGGALNQVNGTFSSPLYPLPYNRSAECKWEISVPGHHTLTFEFDFFALNSSSGCETNYVEIFEGLVESVGNQANKYCGNDMPAPYISQGSQILVKYVTDVRNIGPGFLARFSMNDLYEPESSSVLHAPTPNEEEHLVNGGTVYLMSDSY